MPSRSLPPAPSVEKPSVEKSPGMQHFLRSRASSVYSTLALAADVLQALVGSLGPDTELFRAYAAASVLAYPILRHTRSQAPLVRPPWDPCLTCDLQPCLQRSSFCRSCRSRVSLKCLGVQMLTPLLHFRRGNKLICELFASFWVAMETRA